MVEIATREATSCDLKELVGKFIPEAIGKEIEKACQGIYPLQVGAGRVAGGCLEQPAGRWVYRGAATISPLYWAARLLLPFSLPSPVFVPPPPPPNPTHALVGMS